MNFKVIGISGKAGSGKDYITQKYFAPLGYKQFSLAWHFKIGFVGKGKYSYNEVFHTKHPDVRKELQQEGTERGRDVYGADVWCRTMYAWFELLNKSWGIDKFIVSDIRFPNEVQFVQALGGKVFRLNAPTRVEYNSLTPEARAHISETALDNYGAGLGGSFNGEHFDGIIFNDVDVTEDALQQQIQKYCNIYNL